MSPDLLDGALVALGAFMVGQWLPRPHRRRGQPKPVKPICGCTHDLAHHEPDGNGGGTRCRASVRGKFTRWDGSGSPIGWDLDPCSCKQYTGPRLLDPGYVARELSS